MGKLWNLSWEDALVVDIETKDPDLVKFGAGVYRDPNVSYVLGCGVYDVKTHQKMYFPLHHTDTPSEKEQLRELLGTDRPKVLANAQYDLDWLENREGIPVNGFIHDVQVAEPLLNSYKTSYSLQALAEDYGVQGKKTEDIVMLAERIKTSLPRKEAMKIKAPQQLLYLMPVDVVARYCVGDLEATWEVLMKQKPLLEKEELMGLYECECNLVRICLLMRKNGIRIDQNARHNAIQAAKAEEDELLKKMYSKYGTFNINSSREIAPLLLKDGCDLPRTDKGALSVTKEILDKNANVSPLCSDLRRCRAVNKLRTTFLEKSIEENICPDGRIHGNFYPLKRDDTGTVTGRWSGAHPNLQQIPRNDKTLGALARGMFIPNHDDMWYGHTDYSQVEYRVFSHYARGWKDGDPFDVQAQQMRDLFNSAPHTDYHQFVIDTVKKLTHKALDRPTAKRVNFGVLYFMGAQHLAEGFNMSLADAKAIYDAVFSALPFIDSTRQRVVNSVKLKGYVKTFCGRKQRVGQQHLEKGHKMTFLDGRTVVGDNPWKDKLYPFFNYLIQGTAADIMKFSLVEAYRQGIYDVLELYLLVHDETGTGIPKTKEGIQAYMAQQDVLGNTVKLKVPILAEADYGTSWGVELPVSEGLTVFQQMAKDIGVTL